MLASIHFVATNGLGNAFWLSGTHRLPQSVLQTWGFTRANVSRETLALVN